MTISDPIGNHLPNKVVVHNFVKSVRTRRGVRVGYVKFDIKNDTLRGGFLKLMCPNMDGDDMISQK